MHSTRVDVPMHTNKLTICDCEESDIPDCVLIMWLAITTYIVRVLSRKFGGDARKITGHFLN